MRRLGSATVTDFEEAGLAIEPARVAGAHWLLTVDLEGFTADTVDPWTVVLHRVAERSRELALRFEVFLSLEHVASLRAASRAAYDQLLGALADWQAAGAQFYPHNHCLFDPQTAARPGEGSGFPQRIDGYGKRASMFYDVVHRHRVDFGEWLGTLTQVHAGVLADAGIAEPPLRALRPGGWDHGSTHADLAAYVDALGANGYEVDSSATAGRFGTPSWRVASPVGANAYWLPGGVLELAPTSSLHWGAPLLDRENLRAVLDLSRRPMVRGPRVSGAMVTVLHLNHVFGRGRSLPDPQVVRHRTDRVMAWLSRLQRVLGVRSCGFEDVAVSPPAAAAGSRPCAPTGSPAAPGRSPTPPRSRRTAG
jgi:hypothetical protein